MNLILDIDEYGIDALLVKHVSKNSEIKESCRIKYEDLPENQHTAGLFDSALAVLSEQIDITSCASATLLIPSSSVCFRNIELPFRSARKIRQILPLEIESNLPVADQKYISDFRILNIHHKENLVTVFTASAVESDIEKYISALSIYGIPVKNITPKGYAVAMAILNEKPSAKNFICLDLGLNETSIILVYDREPVSVRSFPAATYGLEKIADGVKQAFLGFRQSSGIEAYFDIFITKNEIKALGKLYAGLENIIHYQGRFKDSDDVQPQLQELKELNNTHLIAASTLDSTADALINFYKIKTGSDSFFRKNFKPIATSIILAGLVFILSLYNLHLEILNLNKRIDTIKNKTLSVFKSTFPEEKDIGYPLLQMQSLVKKKISDSSDTRNGQPAFKLSDLKVVHILAVLSQIIPDTIDMEISRFSFDQARVVLSGTTDNFKNVDTIKGFIEKTGLFKQISIDNASVDKKTGLILFNFTIQM